jgi:hypothetical protein
LQVARINPRDIVTFTTTTKKKMTIPGNFKNSSSGGGGIGELLGWKASSDTSAYDLPTTSNNNTQQETTTSGFANALDTEAPSAYAISAATAPTPVAIAGTGEDYEASHEEEQR